MPAASVALGVKPCPRGPRMTRGSGPTVLATSLTVAKTGAMSDREAILDLYDRYLAACNARDWERLGDFVADEVAVNGRRRTRDEYVADIRATVAVFPDYVWELRRAVVEGEWLAVHLYDRGTRQRPFMGAPGDGARVETDEFDLYRIVDGRIVIVDGTADNARLQSGPTE